MKLRLAVDSTFSPTSGTAKWHPPAHPEHPGVAMTAPASTRVARTPDCIVSTSVSREDGVTIIRTPGAFKLADRLWHSDSSFKAIPAKYSLLSGRAIPSWGGATEFADMRAAYDALDERWRREIEGLVCLHSQMYSREKVGFTELSDAEREAFKPVRQRLVRRHPVTGRKSLFLSGHAGMIEGMSLPEARMLLHELTEFATQERFVYSHAWQVNDLVVWDNRATMHRGRRFDPAEPRDVRQTRLAGDTVTIEQTA